MLAQFIPQALRRYAGRLRFPQLFALVAFLFVVDVFVPDLIPMIDEVILGLLTLLFGSWKDRMDEKRQPEIKDVTPPDDSASDH